MSLNIDLEPLWDAIETYFPTFFSILVIPAGISIAIVLAMFLIDKVRDAFK